MSIRGVARDLTPPILLRAARKVLGRAEALPQPEEPIRLSFCSRVVGSYSQYGEDLVIDAVLGCSKYGFYVDIGANDPVVLSNTKRFSLRGWTGINVEPNPAAFHRIVQDRPNDLNLNLGVGASDEQLTFYSIDPDTLSTFDEDAAACSLQTHAGARLVETVSVQVTTLSGLLSQHVPAGKRVDFLSMDVEGVELQALRSNDWSVNRPRCLMIEIAWFGDEIAGLLADAGYDEAWCNGTNALFVDRHDDAWSQGAQSTPLK